MAKSRRRPDSGGSLWYRELAREVAVLRGITDEDIGDVRRPCPNGVSTIHGIVVTSMPVPDALVGSHL